MKLNISIIQYNIIWEEIGKNLKQLMSLINQIDESTDIIILPEMFATGFSMNTQKISQTMEGEVINWLMDIAKSKQVAIIGTQAIKENNSVFNRAIFVVPTGQVQFYDKRHLFSPGSENKSYTKGSERKVFNYKGVRIFPQICYDLRFPVWSRNINDYDLIINMANWPESRISAWNTLLKARAIENQCYVIGVNRIGSGGGIDYSGQSQLIDYKGKVILSLDNEINIIKKCTIDLELLKNFKEKFPVYLDSDKYELKED